MKKLVLKTVFVTIGVVLVLAVSVFGIVSLCAPRAMMRLSASLGLDGISGDYAYEEYERSGDLGCLARSFLISAGQKNDRTAEERFEIFVAEEGFEQFCKEHDAEVTPSEMDGLLSYRDYVMGQGACVKYRLAKTDAEKTEVVGFAVGETEPSFPAGNPSVALAVEAARAGDGALCEELRAALLSEKFGGNEENEVYSDIIGILEKVIKEEATS